jgi:hypothetical protein
MEENPDMAITGVAKELIAPDDALPAHRYVHLLTPNVKASTFCTACIISASCLFWVIASITENDTTAVMC